MTFQNQYQRLKGGTQDCIVSCLSDMDRNCRRLEHFYILLPKAMYTAAKIFLIWDGEIFRECHIPQY